MDIYKIIVMVLVGGLAGTLAARIMKGTNYGFAINAILGIAGAVVGGSIFNFLGIAPGKSIVDVVDQTFGVSLPPNYVGMIVSATIGAMIILWVSRIFGRKR